MVTAITKPSCLEDSLFLARYLVLDVASQLYITLIGNLEAAPYLYVNLVGIRRLTDCVVLSVPLLLAFSLYARALIVQVEHGLTVLPSTLH